MADEDLVEAESHLRKYVEESKCGWCRKQGRRILDAAKELRSATPTALDITDRFKQEIGDTRALDALDDQMGELSEQRERTERFKDRLERVMSRPPESRALPYRAPLKRTPDEGPPPLPPIVTPDDIEESRREDLERFHEMENRRTGPVRERLRFRLWRRFDKFDNNFEGPLARRSKQ